MQVTDIIVILLFVIPGVIVDKIRGFIDVCDRKKDSEFKEIAEGVLTSLPIIFIMGLFSYRKNGFININQFTTAFNDISYVFSFALGVLSLSIVCGVFSGALGITKFSIVNILRKRIFKKVDIDDKTCWQNFFRDDRENQFLVIENNDKVYEGFIRWYSLPSEEKEVVLYIPESLDPYPEYRQKFNKIKNTYVNIEKNIVIKDYDMTEYNNWVDELYKKHQQTIS